MAYFMLDLLFLLGDPKRSTTLLDNPVHDGLFNVGEAIPPLERIPKQVREEYTEPRVRIDKTSQLLIAMSITIAEFVKAYYNRSNKSRDKKEEDIRQLSGFE